MEFKTEYIKNVYESVKQRSSGEIEFLQALEHVLKCLGVVVEKRLEAKKMGYFGKNNRA